MSDSPNLRRASMPVPVPLSAKVAEALGFGVPDVDRWLKGGLRRDGVHELYAPPDDEGAGATAFALLLGRLICDATTPLIWLRKDHGNRKKRPYAPGLAELGIDPDALFLVELPELSDLLIATVESVRHGGAGAVILEMQGRARPFDLTASRRLALAAERSGTAVLVVRGNARPVASAAHTRWQVSAAPSPVLPANAPGHPVFDLRLLRQRGGPEGLHVQLEWNREQAVFRTPLYGDSSAVPARGMEDRGRRRAA